MIYELRKIESNWSLNELSRCWSAKKKRQQVFQPNRNAFQVRLLLFRQVANRNQIPIRVQETTAAVRFAGPDQPVSNFPFYSNRPPFAQNGTLKIIKNETFDDYFALPPSSNTTKEDEPTRFILELCLFRRQLGNRWTFI